ncbi:MAG: competence/damage-inducible protein A [Ruminococcaceae bacterium]|nr:competence/damage-inducible protein A [Oscillospiraceae bacterium]
MNKIATAEILCVGTELLLGDIVNTNAAFLSQRLADLGICVYRHTAVGDNPKRLEAALKCALDSADLVITSGGLGPTYDDLTKETVAACFGLPLEEHAQSLERIKSYFSRTGRTMTENNKKQAMMPRTAHVFDNNYGTAPALAIYDEKKDKTVIMLPGPPNELIPLFNEEVTPYLKKRTDCILVSKNIHFFGIGESALEEKIKSIMTESQNPTVAPYCKEGEVRLRVTAKAQNESQAVKMCDAMIEKIVGHEVGEFIYGIDVDSLEHALVNALHEHSLSICTAESCTGGLIAERITAVAGCSDVFFGGCVTYTNEIKQRLLGVSAETLDTYGAVSAETAMEMARGAREKLGTDIAVSATGIAGPSGGTPETPVGTVFIGVSTQNGESFRKLSLSSMRSRDYIRTVSATNAFDIALKAVSRLTKN